MSEEQSGQEPLPSQMVTKVTDAPVMFVDGLYHAHTVNAVVRMAFARLNAEPLDTPFGDTGFQSTHVVTLALPLSQLRSVANYLNITIAKWESDGVLPPEGS